jgi:3-oxoisoapionate decarboxylase
MGIVQYSFSSTPHLKSPLDFLEYCASLGAGGVQMEVGSLSDDDADRLRRRAEELEMTLEVIVALPKQADVSTFERAVAQAKRAGAVCLRTACPSGRRYETFQSLDDWKQFVADSKSRIRLALPVLEKVQIPMGIENHKDWTADELAGIVKDFSNEYLGVCLDTGNNLSLLDEPDDLVRSLAPFAVTTHFKDMAVEEYADGFLLSEVPLGEGFLDLAGIISTIRSARPKARINLEMITRDPLKIPCLTDRYWATFPECNGLYLARMMELVRAHKLSRPLPQVSGLDPAARAALEESNVKACIHYARENLGLV